ncbi:MoxR family ATPase [Spirulina sp. CCNP1310]|uniref:AAA family ATPase n=1 Tax=Spirulina sp. CCNP1310 TaxID=3110249 RepID=UPI002B21A296|nr:MoxR family ATPase [Spirulina sp. CCNP1310]MEA5421151.1 MoxR family ATPase [Spirulina sp. CCNP1310]
MKKYTGKVHPPQGETYQGKPIYPYFPSTELIDAVNLAIFLKRPLLLQGEPGCGKTRLAQAVAYELKLPYAVWTIKSTSKAQDGLYTYDNLARLRDAQLISLGQVKQEQEIARMNDPESYVKLGPLGKAFENEEQMVVLIDEIDKADIDFPNDLLLELDENYFTIDETGREVSAKHPPIIFITSNQERDLPDAFLRRCLFHYIEFPKTEDLIRIILARHFGANHQNDPLEISPELSWVEKAVERFLEVREILKQEKGEGGKMVSTSELIDWFEVLKEEATEPDLILERLDQQLPHLSVLLKKWDDHKYYIQWFKGEV